MVYHTYSGKLTRHAAPTIENVAISLCRESRYVGNGKRWWNVGLHSFVVADLLPNHLKFHGLLHDEPETITGDTPKELKTDKQREFEDLLLSRFYNSVGAQLPTPEEHIQIKAADILAVHGEVWTGAGTETLKEKYAFEQAPADLIQHYMNTYSYADCLDFDGAAVQEFIRRFKLYKMFLPSQYVCSGPAYKL